MDNAVLYGYEFEIIKGYKFKHEVIFFEYIDVLFKLRQQFNKTHPMNLIAKLLMNSLYGKFGMKPERSLVEIYDTSSDIDMESLKFNQDTLGESIQDYIRLDNHFVIVRQGFIAYSYDEKNAMYHGMDVNIGIASAVTAGGRIYMSQFKNRKRFNLY